MLGYSLPEIVSKLKRPACSICGLIKRYLLNAVAQEIGANYIATGHHLDDLVPFILKNLMYQNLHEISKLGPKTLSENGLIGKIRPLYEVSEFETEKFTELMEIPRVMEKCPYSLEPMINKKIKEFVNKIEKDHRGFKIFFARSIAKNLDFYKIDEEEIKYCKYCNSPTNSEICAFCKLTEKLTGKPLGQDVKNKIREIINTS